MILSQLKRTLEVSLSRPDLADHYKDWVNEALDAVYQDISFNCMRFVTTVTVAVGSNTAALPANFKELTPEQWPVNLTGDDGALIPVEVVSRERLIHMRGLANSTSAAIRYDKVFLSSDGSTWAINYIDVLTSPATLSVSYFRLLNPLESDDESNYVTNTYPLLVKAKVKEIAFGEINDPLAAAWAAAYQEEKLKASRDDARRWVSGRTIRMGG